MKAGRVFCFTLLLALWIIPLVPGASFAGYPDRPINLVIPYVAGATGDITARMLAEELEKILGAKIIPINKPGAGTVLGVDAFLREKKDGYTLFYGGASPFIYAPIANPKVVHYDPAKDVYPLGFHYYFPSVVGVKGDAPWKNFQEFAADAKKNPGKFRISSIGVGTSVHFAIEMLQSITGIQLTHVPFEGGESTVTAVMGGHVECTLDGYGKLKPHAEAGRMRIILIDPKKPDRPEIPTLKELGYPRGIPATWFAIWTHAGAPQEAIKVLVPAVEKAVNATKSKIEALGSICVYKSPDELRKDWAEEYKEIQAIADKIGIGKK